MNQAQPSLEKKSCYQCEGKGYTEIRDCGGQIQRTESCSYCEGSGYSRIKLDENIQSDRLGSRK